MSRNPLDGESDPLYCLVTAPSPDALKEAVHRIKEVIRLAVECPEEQNELKRLQLRELALLNGTLRDDERFLRCSNCGSVEHKTFQCSEKANFVNKQTCEICGGVGHVAADCRNSRPRVRCTRSFVCICLHPLPNTILSAFFFFPFLR